MPILKYTDADDRTLWKNTNVLLFLAQANLWWVGYPMNILFYQEWKNRMLVRFICVLLFRRILQDYIGRVGSLPMGRDIRFLWNLGRMQWSLCFF